MEEVQRAAVNNTKTGRKFVAYTTHTHHDKGRREGGREEGREREREREREILILILRTLMTHRVVQSTVHFRR